MSDIDNKTYCVYKHTSPSNKSYIGVTSMNPQKRWRNGNGYNHNVYFSNAIKKYGWGNFTHEILSENLTQEEAYQMEIELIKKYNTFDSRYGYNLTTGGEIGKQHTDEVRKNQSDLAKRLWKDDGFRKSHSKFLYTPRNGELNPNYGNHKLSGKNHPNYGKKRKPETIEKIRRASSNISDETRRKMSEAAKARMTPERIEYLRQLATGRHPSIEVRQKMSDSQKARWNDGLRKEYSEKFSGSGNGMYGKHHSEETKQLLRNMFSGENSQWYGKHHSDESKQKAHDSCTWKVPVVKLTLDGEFVEEFDSCASAAKSVDKKPSKIIECCNGNQKSAYGYMWIKKDDYDNGNINVYKNNSRKVTIKLTEDWEYIDEYASAADAAKTVNGNRQNVGRSCRSKGEFLYKQFRWMYKEDYLNLVK